MALHLASNGCYGVMIYNNNDYPDDVINQELSKFGKVESLQKGGKNFIFIYYKHYEEARACLDALKDTVEFNAKPALPRETHRSEYRTGARSRAKSVCGDYDDRESKRPHWQMTKSKSIANLASLNGEKKENPIEDPLKENSKAVEEANDKSKPNENIYKVTNGQHKARQNNFLPRSKSVGRIDIANANRRADIIKKVIESEHKVEGKDEQMKDDEGYIDFAESIDLELLAEKLEATLLEPEKSKTFISPILFRERDQSGPVPRPRFIKERGYKLQSRQFQERTRRFYNEPFYRHQFINDGSYRRPQNEQRNSPQVANGLTNKAHNEQCNIPQVANDQNQEVHNEPLHSTQLLNDETCRVETQPNTEETEVEKQPFIVPMQYFIDRLLLQEAKESHLVVVGGLPAFITYEHLCDVCTKFASILKIKLVEPKNPGEQFRAYVHVRTKEDALVLVKRLNKRVLFGNILIAFIWTKQSQENL